jgi:hypothetical protein
MMNPISDKREDLTRNDTSSKADTTTPSDASARLASSVAHSPLFRLSPEIRNRIYRLALFKDREHWHDSWWTMVDKPSGIKEPALLSSNKIIRSEASGIFYYENQFHCYVDNFDLAPMWLLKSKFTMPLCDLIISNSRLWLEARSTHRYLNPFTSLLSLEILAFTNARVWNLHLMVETM